MVSGQVGDILLRAEAYAESPIRADPLQGLPVVPRHPPHRVLGQLLWVFLQFGEVIERIGVVQFAAVDQTHEQIAHLGAVLGFIEQTILSMQNSFFQRPLDEVRVQRSAGLTEEERQAMPMP